VLVVLMLSGGEALEQRAVSRAGDVLASFARRMPVVAHRKSATGEKGASHQIWAGCQIA
jgi:cation transport ATPase